MAQSGWRLPDELLKRVRVRCAEEGVRQNAWVAAALEEKLNGGPTYVIDSSLIAAAKPVPLKFSDEEERQHAEALRRELSRQLVSEPKPAKKPAKPLGKGFVPPRLKGK